MESEQMTETRRPIATRSAGWAQALARRLSQGSITPNQISQVSMLFAALAGAAFWASGPSEGLLRATFLVLAASGCQLRLICNLLDGMVAVEGGKSAPDGPFWNEAPDRASDIAILAGLGLAAYQPALGFAAATLAVMTAYVREMGRAEGAGSDFSGPMAKPQRMAITTIAAIAAIVEQYLTATNYTLIIALWIVVLGALFTSLRRSRTLLAYLKSRDASGGDT